MTVEKVAQQAIINSTPIGKNMQAMNDIKHKKPSSPLWRLLGTRRFAPLFVVQWCGAFNDNLLKQAIILQIVFGAAHLDGGMWAAVAMALFIAPFFVVSPVAGVLADTHDKAQLTRLLKLAEIAIASVAGWALMQDNVWLWLGVLFFMGVQSAFFGAIKYSILPEYLAKKELLSGNALVEAGTFIAILAGTLLAGILFVYTDGVTDIMIVLMTIAVLGYGASVVMPATPRRASVSLWSWSPLRQTLFFVMQKRALLFCILAISLFFLTASVVVTQLPHFVQTVMGGDEAVSNVLFALFAVGIAVGSLLIRWLLRGEIAVRYAPYGLFFMSLFLADAAMVNFTSPIVAYGNTMTVADMLAFPYLRIAVDLFLLAVAAGFYVVPCYALLQLHSTDDQRARVIALSNMSDAFFIVVGAGISLAVMTVMTVAHLWMLLAVLNLMTIEVIRRLHRVTHEGRQ